MENFIKKNINIIISILLLISPFLDLLTGICVHYFEWKFTIGIIVRILTLVWVIITTLFIYKKKKLLIPYFIIGLYFIFYIVGIILFKENNNLFSEIQGLLKTFYFPLLLISLYAIREEIRISKLTLFTTLFFYLILIFVPYVFHVGYKTYEITKVGTLGFFNSANEVGGIISILTPILFYVISTSKKRIPQIIFGIMYLVVVLMVGSKTPLLSLGITTGFTMTYLWLHWFREKAYKKSFLSLGIVLLGISSLLLVLPRTNFYKNIKTHLEFLEIDSMKELFSKEEYIDHFIFSQRLTFLKDKHSLYKESSTYQKIFGIGYLKNGEMTKQIEMDYFDIFYNHGIIGFILFFSIMIYIMYQILKEKQEKDYERSMMELSTILILVLALFTGHIITAPAVSIIGIVIILSLQKYSKKRILLVSSKEEKLDIEVTYFCPKTTSKMRLLIYKILNYKNYDLSISDNNKINKMYADISSKKHLLLKDKEKLALYL